MNKEKSYTLLGFFLLLWAVVYFFMYYNAMPERVAMHFDGEGQPNGLGSRLEASAVFIIMAVVMLIMHFVKKMDPEMMNMPVKKTKENLPVLYQISKELLSFIIFWCGAFSLFISYQMVQIALANNSELSDWLFWFLLIGLFIMIGYYILKMRKH
ncbi:DUF1648 domain-containing protein [Jiulongibacter sediminis]|uniref:DUF1648 domain-containing protein n=1 Tax=Jiulongibacter sediminis TaxID=1605367 RepID=A0A0P7C5L0_9BACT|nr:DUF1648 domain-containing protein [Jiulongibacter sediminis]KPM48601.1 hypothetical protein AFM12_08295 [Jiulongibacter sediminis]TBX25139.1 hypothetical protein TK44_08300 [Jiulongibacter sediminis]